MRTWRTHDPGPGRLRLQSKVGQQLGQPRQRAFGLTLGALVPLTRPGWAEAGRHLLAGLELAVREVNDAGGIAGRPLELVVRDTAADPQRAEAAVDELAHLGVAALAGEYHSVVARAAAARADALGLPFLCSSAVLDALTEQPTDWVARLPPRSPTAGGSTRTSSSTRATLESP
ncbi:MULTISPECIES: ABC transporter substrate-binding protein [unclassified Nonomuraea]|uniref:ABC transporter substrate-binding protein n=1 Tax=unclassified Nonomuraea TaxID=2593643 RepID=UPI002ED330D3